MELIIIPQFLKDDVLFYFCQVSPEYGSKHLLKEHRHTGECNPARYFLFKSNSRYFRLMNMSV